LDALVIAVPKIDHYEVATAAIERGIHLLIEKPVAYTVAEATTPARFRRRGRGRENMFLFNNALN
jgi:UDP-N-acetylglucosamine 3-dehydrogenase